MSQRKKKAKKDHIEISDEEKQHLRSMHDRRLAAQLGGLSPDDADKVIKAEDSMFKSTGDKRIASGYKQISDIPTEVGTVIHNPVTGKNEGLLDKSGDLRNLDGSIHKATEKWRNK